MRCHWCHLKGVCLYTMTPDAEPSIVSDDILNTKKEDIQNKENMLQNFASHIKNS